MKTLPLLSSDFKTFSWTSSIGNATDEQLQKAYDALVSQGKTVDFSYSVWNDLVDLLNQAITKAGFEWDNTYATVEKTKMMWHLSPLNAYQFNSVTLNISNLIGIVWRWEVDTTSLGYLGRRQVYGVSERGEKADIVYGWYILELARVINLFIDVLKNEADFRELKIAEKIDTNNDSILLPRPAAPLNVAYQILTKNDVDLLIRKACYLNFQTALRTGVNAYLHPAVPSYLISRNASETQSKADIERIRPKWVKADDSSKTLEQATIRSGKATRIYGDYSHHTKNNAYMSFNECFDMYVINRVNTNNDARAVKIPSLNVSFDDEHFTNSHGEIYKAVAYDLAAEDNMYTDYSSLLNCIPAFNLGTAYKNSYSKHRGSINAVESLPLESLNGNLHTSHDASLNAFEPEYLHSNNKSTSEHKCDVIAALPKSMESLLRDSSYDHAELIRAEPSYIQSSDSSFTLENGDLARPGAKIFSFAEKLLSSHKVHLTGGRVLELIADNHSITRNRVYIAFDGIEDEWVIQTGENLYIKQVYSSEKDENNLSIDCGWFKPVQEENDLYIQSVYRSYNDNEKLFVDVDFYLEPIQEGSNLHIRQDFMEGDDE